MEDLDEHYSKVEENKQLKKDKLLSSAYTLFIKKGVDNTSINDIVEDAGIAKGTFYLYFKDKEDIKERVITEKSRLLFDDAVIYLTDNKINKFDDKLISMIDFIIDSLNNNKDLMKLIGKNLYLGLFNDNNSNEIVNIKKMLCLGLKQYNNKLRKPEIVLFLIFNSISSVIYESIILEKPTSIENLKPILYKQIKKIIQLK